MTPDDRLTAFLGETPAPAATDILAGGAAALTLGVVLWACSPVLNLAVDTLAPTLLPVAGILALTLAVAVMGGRLLPQD
jgi:hypothetical protein